MDIDAYMQIYDLEKVAQLNGISVPRLRGYRLMKDESALSAQEIAESVIAHELELCERACRSVPRFKPNSGCSEYPLTTKKLIKKYLIQETKTGHRDDGTEYTYTVTTEFRWDRIRGKNKKELKFSLKKGKSAVIKQLETFNKYAGRDDILYIHARIGGGNWDSYGGPDLEKKPWFVEKVDDYFDSTYCDIYAKIDPATVLAAKELQPEEQN